MTRLPFPLYTGGIRKHPFFLGRTLVLSTACQYALQPSQLGTPQQPLRSVEKDRARLDSADRLGPKCQALLACWTVFGGR